MTPNTREPDSDIVRLVERVVGDDRSRGPLRRA
jgi:hypothetical protein